MTDAEIAIERLTDWVRDYGDAKPKEFIGDISLLLVIAKGAMEKKEPKPLPCPFCGSDNLAIGDFYVFCRDCDCDGPTVDVTGGKWPSEQQVIEAWNKRVTQ
jgi:hypothetical protein